MLRSYFEQGWMLRRTLSGARRRPAFGKGLQSSSPRRQKSHQKEMRRVHHLPLSSSQQCHHGNGAGAM